jgi:hypothetical protein
MACVYEEVETKNRVGGLVMNIKDNIKKKIGKQVEYVFPVLKGKVNKSSK